MHDWFSHIANHQEFIVALVVGFCGGICCVLIDLDHPIAYWVKGKPSRFAHKYVAIIASLVILGVVAYLGRLCYH